MERCETRKLSGWGRCPVEECHVYRPEKRGALSALIGGDGEATFIPRGLGRSYGDTSLNAGGGVLDYTRLNRMRAFDPETGVLECEAGVSLAEILDAFVPRGFFPSVLPGTKFVTVGGAIANDIHGKNHHRDGAFSQFVEQLTLLTPEGEELACSREDNADVFWATVGGIGLTGLIRTARIKLQRVESAYVTVDYLRAKNIDEALAAMAESDENYQYSVAWVDCLAKGASLGRSVLMRGNHAPAGAVARKDPLRIKPKREKTVPIDFPGFALNRLSVGAFNAVFYGFHKTVSGKQIDYDQYFCPLDSIHDWNRMYGKRGFTQYQVTFPLDARQGLVELLEKISASGRASFLAVLKRLGPQGPGLLSYPCGGYTITLDLPMRKDLIPFLHGLDERVLEHGGRLYCAKDVCTLPETFAAMYPRLEQFQEVKARLDPNHRFSSTMARRLRIVPAQIGGMHAK